MAAAGVLSVITALAEAWPVPAAALAGAAALVLLARLDVKLVLARLAVVNGFILFLWVFLPFSTPGAPVFHVGPLAATREGLAYAALITIKSNAVILFIIALLSTSTTFAIIHALRHLKAPEKLVGLFFFTFRYFQVIHAEYLRLRDAMRIRCFTPGTNLHTYRTTAWLVGMLLVRSFDRSERVYQAMLCRGFNGRFWLLSHFHFHRADYWFMAAAGLYAAGLLGLTWIAN
jgi:cobalt/nickel transport system permease protein